MPEEDIVISGLYAHNYLRTDEILRDDTRMRFRLGKLFAKIATHKHSDAVEFGSLVESELGFSVLRSGPIHVYFPYDEVVKEVKIVDLLHIITLLFKFLGTRRSRVDPNKVCSEIQRIFDETNVGYKLDVKGGVHPKLDEEFERVRVSAIRKLGSPEFATERQYVEAVEQALLTDPLDGKAAIRSTFDAVENLYKQMFPNAMTQPANWPAGGTVTTTSLVHFCAIPCRAGIRPQSSLANHCWQCCELAGSAHDARAETAAEEYEINTRKRSL